MLIYVVLRIMFKHSVVLISYYASSESLSYLCVFGFIQISLIVQMIFDMHNKT